MRRLGAGQRHHLRGDFCRDRRLAGLAGLVAQQTANAALGKALLPPPHRWPADPNALRHPLCRVPLRRGEHDARPLDVLTRRLRSAAIAANCSCSVALNTTHTRCAMAPIPPPAMAQYRISSLAGESYE